MSSCQSHCSLKLTLLRDFGGYNIPRSKNHCGYPCHSDILGGRYIHMDIPDTKDIPDTEEFRAERISKWTSLLSRISA